METKTEAPAQRPDWGGWVVVVTLDNGDGWTNGIFDNEDEAETHADLERAEGRHARALSLWVLDAAYLHHVEGLTYDTADDDEDDDDETAEQWQKDSRGEWGRIPTTDDDTAEWRAGKCWKCGAVVRTSHTLCMECLTQQ